MNVCGNCVEASVNKTLSEANKDILRWHWKLGIGIKVIQELMKSLMYEEQSGNMSELPRTIKTKFQQPVNVQLQSVNHACWPEQINVT